MAANSKTTLHAILENDGLFFKLMARQSGACGTASADFKRNQYEHLLYSASEHMEPAARRSFLDTLSIENLDRNGLLAYLDNQKGCFLLQEFVLDMLRHLDSKRLKELSSSQLHNIHMQLVDMYRQVKSPDLLWIDGDDDFEEVVGMVVDTLRSVAFRIRTNVRALRGQADHLARIIDDRDYSELARTDQVATALKEILRIHERHITPTLEFLNSRLDIKAPAHRAPISKDDDLLVPTAPMAIITAVIKEFQNHRRHDHVTQLQRLDVHIATMGDEVMDVSRGLSVYLRFAEDERLRHERTEELYNRMLEAVKAKQTGKKNFMLQTKGDVFKPVAILGNLKSFNQIQTSNINWPASTGTMALDELLRIRIEKEDSRPKTVRTKVTRVPLTEAQIAERKMIERIGLTVKDFDYCPADKDLYLQLHEHLMQNLDNYQLKHIFDAIPFLMGDIQTSEYSQLMTLSYNNEQLRYRLRHLAPATTDSNLAESI